MNRVSKSAALLYLIIGHSSVLGIDKPVNDDTCQTDKDCTEKNVGSCCGSYPKCVNKGFEPDIAAVEKWCEETGMMSVCGWSEIDSCFCLGGICRAIEVDSGEAPFGRSSSSAGRDMLILGHYPIFKVILGSMLLLFTLGLDF